MLVGTSTKIQDAPDPTTAKDSQKSAGERQQQRWDAAMDLIDGRIDATQYRERSRAGETDYASAMLALAESSNT